MEAVDLDEYLERTVRFDGISIPPQAIRGDDGPTVTVPAPAMAVLAAQSARSTSRRAAYSGYPPPVFTGRRLRTRIGHARAVEAENPAMRNAVIGIWMVAAFLFATLGILAK